MASMVTTGGILADIGTDHAYVPIALVQRQKIKGAIAMDINEGPLARAQEHIRAARLEEYIQTRLSDGAEALLPNEADSILIAGMGGELILHILTEGESVCSTAKELILQPQSEIHKVREYLRQHQKILRSFAVAAAVPDGEPVPAPGGFDAGDALKAERLIRRARQETRRKQGRVQTVGIVHE